MRTALLVRWRFVDALLISALCLAACRPAPVPTPTPSTPVETPRDERARVAFETGVSALHSGRYAEALTSFSWALELAPQWTEARWNRVVALLALARTDEAVAEASALDDMHRSDDSLYLRLWALVAANRFGDALALVDARAPRRPSAGMHVLIGWASLALSDLERAYASAEQGIRNRATRSDALCLRAAVYEARGEADAALDDYNAVLDDEPRHLGALRGSGMLLLSGADPATGRLRLQRFLEVAPEADPDRPLVDAALAR